jgi:hypothetical protein
LRIDSLNEDSEEIVDSKIFKRVSVRSL